MRPLAAVLLILTACVCRAEITAGDLFLFGDMEKHKGQVVKMLNRLAAEHPGCRARIAPNTAGISKDRSTPGNPAFFVQCGDKDTPEVVRFTLEDIAAGTTPEQKIPIKLTTGLEACGRAAKQRGLVPHNTNFNAPSDFGYNPVANGNAVVSPVFADIGIRVFCSFSGSRLTEITVKPHPPQGP